MYRVKKANGWNKYKVQYRFLYLFWRDVKYANYCSKGLADVACEMLNEDYYGKQD